MVIRLGHINKTKKKVLICVVRWIQLKSHDGNVFENGIKMSWILEERGHWFLKQLSFAALGINTKSKIRKTAAVTCVLSTRNPAGIQPCSVHFKHAWSIRRASCDFLKNDSYFFFLQRRAAYFPAAPYLPRLTRRTEPVRSPDYRAKTHSRAARFAPFPAYRQGSSPLVSPAFSRSAVQRRHKLNPTSERDKESHKRHRAAACVGEHKSPVLFKRSLTGFRGLRAPPLLVSSVMQMQRLWVPASATRPFTRNQRRAWFVTRVSVSPFVELTQLPIQPSAEKSLRASQLKK